MSQPVGIRLTECSRTFNQHIALHPLSLEIIPGETLVLLGPSGCGKTTTLRIISGLEQCDPGGEIWFGDRNVTNVAIEKRHVGMVFQNYALFPHLNVAQNVAYGLKIQRLPSDVIRSRVAEMLEMVDLTALAQRPVQALSGGQKQRVALARAMAARPGVLLFDEPLAALDAQLRDRLRDDIGRLLNRLSITAVYVTHDQQEAMALGDRIAVINQGRIEQIGTPREIYHHPETAFVADFIGAVNRIGNHYCRPEDIRLGSISGATLTGQVVESVFLGQVLRVTVDTGSQHKISVDCPPREQWFAGQHVGLHLAGDALFMAGKRI
ncbi:ABC transporter ATP-binding protein [Tatumella citrea]|uniref:Iron ABC transporter substrate-binding protein n=1 Tax=Tatumella citrea TaxID=53336 RepID=A0A1Y0LB99_TATCI|nr:ABC transporter ATP-binding protein [Tatumella citrea]ARU95344.1 iron ABC transporter substrate-binding protein [Tatumella citrea]ARU99385.1 iron ABC transporter substrate-binding protein [Tatumella citrea]